MADINKKKTVDENKQEPDNAGLQKKISNKQGPTDSDKGGLSGKTNSEGGQRANVSTNGAVSRQSVSEIGTDKQRTKNRILNEQVDSPEENKHNNSGRNS